MRTWMSVLAIAFMTQAGYVYAEDNPVGLVKVTRGEAFILRNGERLDTTIGLHIYQQDVLETGENGSLGVTFKDNTRLSLGPNSRMTVNEFVFNPPKKEYSFVTRIAHGTMVYLSGIMAKLSPESVSVETPVATVGIRGTRFLVKIDQKESNHP